MPAMMAATMRELDSRSVGEPSSPVMTLVRETYETLFNKTPNIMVIHAGLECGLSLKNYNDIQVGDSLEVFEVQEIARTL